MKTLRFLSLSLFISLVGCFVWLSVPRLVSVTAKARVTATTAQDVPCQNLGLQLAMPIPPSDSGIVALGDMNGDGWLDVVSANTQGSVLRVYLRNAPNAFAAPLESVLPFSRAVLALLPGDFNGDGKTDVALVQNESTEVRVWLGDGVGGFGNLLTSSAMDGLPTEAEVADLNGDRKADVIVTTRSSSVNVLLMQANGTLAAPVSYATGQNPQAVIARDFDGDNKVDLAVAYGNVGFFKGRGDGSFARAVNQWLGTSAELLATDDLNADGKLDLIVANKNPNAVLDTPYGIATMSLGNGQGSFSGTYTLGTPNHFLPMLFNEIVTGDFNGDNRRDIAISHQIQPAGLEIYLGLGSGNMGAPLSFPDNHIRQLAPGNAGAQNGQEFGLAMLGQNGLSLLQRQANCTLPTNTPPLISVGNALRLTQTGALARATLGQVSDAEQAADTLTLKVTNAPTGLRVESLTNYGGSIIASVYADCNAIVGDNAVTFSVTDSTGATASARLIVSVSALGVATFSPLPNTALLARASGTVATINSYGPERLAVIPPPGFTGRFTLNASGSNNAVLGIENAYPPGNYVVRVQAQLLCAPPIERSFNLLVEPDSTCVSFDLDDASGYAGASSSNSALGDFNGDGKLDVAGLDTFNAGLTLQLGNGVGFAPATRFRTGLDSTALAAADWNNDGRSELMLVTRRNSLQWWQISAATGRWQLLNELYGVTGQRPLVADLNNDGRLDVMLSAGGDLSDLLVILNQGGLNWSAPNYFNLEPGSDSVGLGDFDGDGKLDLASMRYGNTQSVNLARNDGAGGFLPPQTLKVFNNFAPGILAVGDFNNDGKADLAVSDGVNLDVRLNQGNTVFANPVRTPFKPANRMVAADFNGDGRADLAASNGTLWFSQGDGRFIESGTFNISNESLVAVDLNSDQRLEVVSLGPERHTVALNRGAGRFSESVKVVAPNSFAEIADFNGDNRPDFLSLQDDVPGNPSLRLWLNTTSPDNMRQARWTTTGLRLTALNKFPIQIKSGDFNNDGSRDLVMLNSDNTIQLNLNNGSGGFYPPSTARFNGNKFQLFTGEFTGDNRLDIALLLDNRNFEIWANDGNGSFTRGNTLVLSDLNGLSRQAVVADINRDNRLDLAVTSKGDLTVYLGNSNGTFGAPRTFITGLESNATTVAGVDLNVDGRLDFVLTHAFTTELLSMLQNVDGSFAPGPRLDPGKETKAIAVADFNRDSRPDLLLNHGALYLNRPNNTFIRLDSGFPAQSFATQIADFDLNGWPDLIAFDSAGMNIVFHSGTCGLPQTQIINGLTIQQGSPPISVVLATLGNTERNLTNLKVTPLTTPAGLTLTQVTRLEGGLVATLAASCTATTGAQNLSFRLTQGDQTLSTLDVPVNVIANTPPHPGNYSEITMLYGAPFTHTAYLPALDNGTITGFTVTGPPGYTGRFTVEGNNRLRIDATGDAGRYTLSVTASDNCGATGSTPFLLNITKGNSLVTLTASTTRTDNGQPVTLTARARAAAPSLAIPAGRIEFRSGASVLGTTDLDANGEARLTLNNLGGNPRDITAYYLGENSLSASNSPTVSLNTSTLANVTAANYAPALGRGSIVAAFGSGLAPETRSATLPLPTTLGGTTVRVRDRLNQEFAAPLFFVSPSQVNYLMPADLAPGTVTVTLTNTNGTIRINTASLSDVSPGLFTANATGNGLAAAQVLRVLPDGSQRYEAIARFDTNTSQFIAVPIELSNANEQVFLILYGSGWRYRSALSDVAASIGGTTAEVLYTGAQGSFAGLDQINLRLPRNLAGRGNVDVVLSVYGISANSVKVNIK